MKYILPVFLLLVTGSCSTEEIEPVPEPVVETVNRTVLVYMVANNSLGVGSWDQADIAEMTMAVNSGALNGGRLLVYRHSTQGLPVLMELNSAGVTEHKVYDDATYSVDVERMKEVFADVKHIAPAEEYGLVLWSHGTGWAETNNSRSGIMKSFGDDRGITMKIPSLATALDGQGFSFIYFDCCLMANVETVYELRHAAPIIVASAIELPMPGMRYDLNVPEFFKDEPDLVQAARNTFEFYDNSANDRTCAMSVINTSALDDLASATRAIMATGPVPVKRVNLQRFMLGSNCTLYDFGDYIDHIECDEALKDAWYEALDRVIVYKASTPTIWQLITLSHHSGLSSYVLEQASDSEFRGYNHLQWWTDVVSYNPYFDTQQ